MNRIALTVGLAAMDLCWVYPWSTLLGQWSGGSRPLLSGPSVFGIIFLGALTTQTFGRRAAARRSLRLAMASIGGLLAVGAVRLDQYPGGGIIAWLGPFAAALAGVFGQVSAPVLAFGLGLYLWWRGARLGAQHPGYADVETAFRWGIGLLVAFGLVMALTTRPSLLPALEAQTTPFVVGFFFSSLLTLALGRLESLRTRRQALAVNTQWLGVLVLVAGLVVLVALVLGQLASFNVLILITRPLFDLLGQMLLLVIYAVVIPLSYVIEWLIYLVLSLVRLNADQQPPQPPQASEVDDLLQRLFTQLVPPEVLVVVKAIAAAGLVLVGLLIVARAVSRWRPSSADADETSEERDSVFDANRLARVWLDWLRHLFKRRARVANPAEDIANNEPLVADGTQQSRSVRALYRQVLRLGENVGARRALATTPLEHLPRLQQSLEPAEGLTDLTEAYARARYAEIDDTPAKVAELGERVDRLHPKFGPD
jgi:hypothetical protein